MIDRADQEVQVWIKHVVPGTNVFMGPPALLEGKQGVNLYLLALANPPAAWMNRHPPTRVALRYFVTTRAEDDEAAHHLLGQLLLAALEKPEYELDLTELAAPLWTALGIAPQPAFTLCVPLRVERLEPTIKLVHKSLVMHATPITSLHGSVLGPDDIPIVGASVELPALQLRSHTDSRGQFHFSTVPGEPLGLQLLVKAKGRVQHITTPPASEAEPLVIRFASFSDEQ